MRFLSFISVLFFAFSVNAQTLEGEGKELYSKITDGYIYDAEIISGITEIELDRLNIQGDYKYYALNLISRSNRFIGNKQRALQLAESIPIDLIDHQGTKFDSIFLLAMLYEETMKLSLADSLYEKWLPLIPKDDYMMLAINYNNWASVKQYQNKPSVWLSYLKKSVQYNLQTSDSRRSIRLNRSYRNLSNYYLKTQKIDSAEYYLTRIDTVAADEETIYNYFITKGKILNAKNDFESSMVNFDQAKLSAIRLFPNSLSEEYIKASSLSFDASVLQKKYVKERRINFLQIIFLITVLLVMKYFRVIKKIYYTILPLDHLKEYIKDDH